MLLVNKYKITDSRGRIIQRDTRVESAILKRISRVGFIEKVKGKQRLKCTLSVTWGNIIQTLQLQFVFGEY